MTPQGELKAAWNEHTAIHDTLRYLYSDKSVATDARVQRAINFLETYDDFALTEGDNRERHPVHVLTEKLQTLRMSELVMTAAGLDAQNLEAVFGESVQWHHIHHPRSEYCSIAEVSRYYTDVIKRAVFDRKDFQPDTLEALRKEAHWESERWQTFWSDRSTVATGAVPVEEEGLSQPKSELAEGTEEARVCASQSESPVADHSEIGGIPSKSNSESDSFSDHNGSIKSENIADGHQIHLEISPELSETSKIWGS